MATRLTSLDTFSFFYPILEKIKQSLDEEIPFRPKTTHLHHLIVIQTHLAASETPCIALAKKTNALFNRYLALSNLGFLVDETLPVNKPAFGLHLMLAARSGDVTCLEFLIEKMYVRCLNIEDELGHALSQTVAKSHVACSRILISQQVEIPRHHFIAALPLAAENGDLATLDLILSRFQGFPQHTLTKALAHAAKRKDNPCFNLLLNLCPEAEGIDLRNAASSLIKNHDMKNLTELLTPPRRLSPSHMGDLLCDAITARLDPATDFLLSLGELDLAKIGMACIEASKLGSFQVLKVLLNGRRPILKTHYGEAAVQACLHGHFDCLQFILSDGRKLSKIDMSRALHAIMTRKHFGFFPFLTSQCEAFDEFDLILSYRDLAANGELELLHFLANQRLPEEISQLSHAIKSAIIFNKPSSALFLISLMPELSCEAQKRLLKFGIESGMLEIIPALLSKRALSYEDKVFLLSRRSPIDPERLKQIFEL